MSVLQDFFKESLKIKNFQRKVVVLIKIYFVFVLSDIRIFIPYHNFLILYSALIRDYLNALLQHCYIRDLYMRIFQILANTDIAGGEAVNNFLDIQPALSNLQPMFSTGKKEPLIQPTLYIFLLT